MSGNELHKSIQSFINDDKISVRKSIVIGVGECGMNSVMSAMEWIEESIPAEAHRYMRWVGIDTTDIEAGTEGKGGKYRFPSDQFFQEERRMLYLSSPVPGDLSPDFLRDKHDNDPCFSWLPNPDVYDIATRAGLETNQTRPLGRLAFFYNEKKIREALIKERDRLAGLPDDPEYFQLVNVKEGEDKRGAQVSVFITASISGGTGSGMFLDLAAMVRDIFSGYWPEPRVYGILVLPPAFKRVANNRNARANVYAALKEIDYFMSGNIFRALYPSGRDVEIPGRIFDDGMLYLFDIENMAGNSLQGCDQVQELTGQFLATFVSSIACGVIEERTVDDPTRTPAYLPANEKSQRRASYNSFGISRAVYPVPNLKNIGYRIVAARMIEAFLLPADSGLLLETVGDINRGLVRALRLDCRLIFERMYPDYRFDIEAERRSCSKKLEAAEAKREAYGIVTLMENIISDYGMEETEKRRDRLLAKMEKRLRLELDKMRSVLVSEIHNYIKDPKRGLNFAGNVLDLLLAKIEIYQKKYYEERVALTHYSTGDMKRLVEEARNSGEKAAEYADAVIQMALFNFEQMMFEAMLASAENFIREFKYVIFGLKNMGINTLRYKVTALRDKLKEEIEQEKFRLLENKNPFFTYLIDNNEINSFIEKHFNSRLSFEDLCSEVDLVRLDGENDTLQFIETYLVSTEGLKIIELGEDEVKSMITGRFGSLLEKPVDEVKSILFEDSRGDEAGLQPGEESLLRIDMEIIRKKLFKIIYSKLERYSFENISIKEMHAEKKILLSEILERLDNFSRPYIYIDPTGLSSKEHYCVITNFGLNTYEEGDVPENAQNDLPARLNHYRRRETAHPVVRVETFEVPKLCKPYEIISIGVLPGFPLFKINSLDDSAKDYHDLIMERTHPLHNFNSPDLDAKYFPDPFRHNNYLNPAKLWSGLLLLKVLEERDGAYAFEEILSDKFKDVEAREGYRKIVLDIDSRITAAGGYDEISPELLAETVNALGMMAKNNTGARLQFRREYSPVIMDILDGDGSGAKAAGEKLSKDEYIEKFLKPPQFADTGELIFFLENERNVREFIVTSVKSVIERTKGNVKAGADIAMPKWKIDEAVLPVFKDRAEFYDYYEKQSSLEWQNILRERLTDKLNDYVSSSRFRLESDPAVVDRAKAGEFLRSLGQRMPDIVLWEVKVKNKIIK